MKKTFFSLLFIFGFNTLFAQQTVTPPNREEWTTYFYKKLESIQTTLYTLALNGTIKAYRTDSMQSTFSLSEINERGSTPATAKQAAIPFSPDGIEGIWFVEESSTGATDIIHQEYLKGIALIFQPSFMGARAMSQPLIYINSTDLKTHLTADEFAFISILYYYSSHSNFSWERVNQDPDEDIYYYFNTIRHSFYITDSTFIHKMVNMCVATNDYILDHMRLHPDQKIIIDLQSLEPISFEKFNATYYTTYNVRMVTGMKNNKEVWKDTVYNEPRQLLTINAIGFSLNLPSQFFYNLTTEQNTTLHFSISLKSLKDNMVAPVNLWFFEDYYRRRK